MATLDITNSSKYMDIISNSVMVSSGRPAVFQLKTKTQQFGTLTRMTLGERNVNKMNKTILLVGETGAGKSALINALVNYCMGVKFEDEVWFQIVEDKKRSQSECQTSDVMLYEVFGFEDQTLPYSLTIIDTPGFGDTRGIEHDVNISQRLFDLFRSEDGVHEVDAVGLVVKATDNQTNGRVSIIFNSVMSLFGKNMEENIVALITHSDGRNPKNALQALQAANVKCQPVYFLFDNQQDTQRTQENVSGLETAQTITERGICEFATFLERTTPKQMETTAEPNACIRLAACIQNLQERIKLSELKLTEIKQITEALKTHEDMKKKEEFTVEVDEVYKDKINTESRKWGLYYGGAVCCTVCEENCHYPGCTMAMSPRHCEVMKRGHCTVCTNKCPASAHVKEKWRYVTKTRRVKRTRADLERYANIWPESKNGDLLESLEKEMDQLTAEKSQLLDQSYQRVVKLEQIALNVDAVSIHVQLDFLIEKMKERGDTKKIQKLEEIESQMNEGTRTLLQHMNRVQESEEQCYTQQMEQPAANSSWDFLLKTDAPICDTKTAVKYKDIISNSVVISSGRPAIYQLRPKKEQFGTLTRMTLGERNVNKINKTILLVGGTGAGKSTLINTLVNYCIGVKFEDEIWFQIVEDERRCQTQSQTSDVMVYGVFGFEGRTLPYSLTIIDTPGFGDTRGIEHDVNISQRLFDLFRSEQLHEVDVVGLVMKASVNRLSDQVSYVFNSVMSLFGKNMEENIVALITHSDGRNPKNALQALQAANVKCAKDEKGQPVYFLFDNCQHEDRTEDPDLEIIKDISDRGMSQFTKFLEKTTARKLEKTVDVMNERIRLAACIQNLQERIKLSELKQSEIRQITETLNTHEDMEHEVVTVEVDEHYKHKEPIASMVWGLVFIHEAAVCCTVCEETCHYPGCTMAKSPSQCEVMKNGRCTSCTKKCPATVHVREKWRYVTKTRRVQKTVTQIKQETSKKNVSALENLEKEMKQLAAEKCQLLDESYQLVVSLEQNALIVVSVSTHVDWDFLIEKLKDKEDTEKVQKLEKIRNQMDDATKSALQYMWGKCTNAGKKN